MYALEKASTQQNNKKSNTGHILHLSILIYILRTLMKHFLLFTLYHTLLYFLVFERK